MTRAACPFPTVHILAFSLYQFSSMLLVILFFLWLLVTFAILFSNMLASAIHKATPLFFLENMVLFFSLASYENDIYTMFTMSVN